MFINQGDGTFPNSSSYATGDNPHYLVAEDIDADVDLIVPNETNIGSISLFFNLGDGRVSDSRVDVPVSAGPRSVVVDDVDGDGEWNTEEHAAFVDAMRERVRTGQNLRCTE